jgi:tRNA-modifying protein YgfZ
MSIVDTSSWGVITVRGEDRVRFLQGLTTINVQALAVDRPSWGAILQPKGRVLSMIAIEPRGDELWVRCAGNLVDKTHQLLDRYAVMDDVQFAVGYPASHRVWSTPNDVWTAPFVDGAPAQASADDEIERLRVRGGFLVYGQDIDEDCFPFETPLAQFLDYGKGCYVGQEPVFRVHAQGNTARTLRGFAIEGDAPVPVGAPIQHASKERAGAVTSAVRDGARWLALGYLHRSVWPSGDGDGPEVTIEGRASRAHALPF